MEDKNVIGISVEAVKALIRYSSRAMLTRAEWRSLEQIEADLAKFIAKTEAEDTTKVEGAAPKE